MEYIETYKDIEYVFLFQHKRRIPKEGEQGLIPYDEKTYHPPRHRVRYNCKNPKMH